ncbi:MAG: ATP-binding protein [Chthoniobacteraceae bacterium]|nr:ATP-binding protein [Chthoniobacteraceae bacterium]
MSFIPDIGWVAGGAGTLGMAAAFAFAWTQRRGLRDARERLAMVEQTAAEEARRSWEQALHQAEQTQQFVATLIESAAILILAVDEQMRLRLFNERAQEITGYHLNDTFAGEWLERLFPGEDFAPARDGLRGMMRGEIVGNVETLLVTKSGEERTISWRCRNVIYRDERLSLMLGVDLTDRSLAERERHDLELKLLDMQKLESLGVLAGGIAHDFNNLLTAILGNAQLARLQLHSSSPLQSHLLEIERTSIQAADLCKQMLAYSGQGRIEVRWLDLNKTIRDMSQLLRVSVAKKVQLSFNLAHDLPRVRGDVSQVRQILMNLVINASEAITANEGSIWVSTGVVHRAKELFRGITETGKPEECDYVFIEIADNGCGMSEETQSRIFDPFFTTKFTGRGLGLAAVLGIVRSHGGTLELQSREGEGTTFTLLFPCAEAAEELGVHANETAAGGSPHWSGEGLVLVVDDEETVRSLTKRMLESFEFRVITANDGREGVEQFDANAEAITAVLLDVTMPLMGGMEALERIRAIRPDVPVLFMSGYMREGELRNLDRATDFLQKPFKMEDLQEKLRLLLSEPHPQ